MLQPSRYFKGAFCPSESDQFNLVSDCLEVKSVHRVYV